MNSTHKKNIGELKSSSVIKRYPENPIITSKDIPYPSTLVFNPGVIKYQGKYIMLFRIMQPFATENIIQ